MNNAEVTPSMEIRHLFRDMPNAMEHLSRILNMDDSWKKLAEKIPTSKTDPSPLYNLNDHLLMKRSRDGPTVALIADWGTHGRKNERPTVEYMIKLLCDCELYRAADYLAVDILHGEPVVRNIPPTDEVMLELNLAPASSNGYGRLSSEEMDTDNSSAAETPSSVTSDITVSSDIPIAMVYDGNSLHVDDSSALVSKIVDNLPLSIRHQIEHSTTGDVAFTQPLYSDRSMDVGVEGTHNFTSPQPPTIASDSSSNEHRLNLNLLQSNLPHYSYSNLEAMTNGFNKRNINDGGRRLGSGAFSTVFLGTWRNRQTGTTCNVAVKKMDTKFTEQFLMEVNLMSSFQHRCILQLLAYSRDGPHCCLIYEYMVNGSLQDRLARVNNTPELPWRVRLQIVSDTAQGLGSLHSQGYVHRDVKSANILLDSEFKAKLGDFGIAHIAPDPSMCSSIETKVPIGTSVYMPREAFNGTITVKLDTYSFGVVLLEILTGRKPYDLDTKEDLISFVEDKNIQVDNIGNYLDLNGGDWNLDIAKAVYALSEKCLIEKRNKRPSMFEVMPELLNIVGKMKCLDSENSKMDSMVEQFV